MTTTSKNTTRPDTLVRAKNSGITESVGSFFTSFRRRKSGSPLPSPSPSVSSSAPGDAVSKIISKITASDIKGAEHIGSGGFGTVYVLEHPTLGKVALKQLNVSSVQGGDDLRRRAKREGDTWRGLRHPNVLPFLGIHETASDLYLVSTFAKNGSVTDYIRVNPNVDRRGLLGEAAAAIAFLHQAGVIHGDIKASNILVSDDVHALLCDFGLAKSATDATSILLQGVGTIRFQSPELLLEGGGKTFATDVWAFGMTIYEVLSGSIPFQGYITTAAVVRAIVRRDERPPTLPAASASGMPYHPLWKVAQSCWMKDPNQRPKMEDVREQLGFTVV